MTARLAGLALLAVTAVWGSTFFLIKDLLDRVPVIDFLGVRFALAAVVLLALAPRTIGRLSPRVRRQSVAAGLIYGLAQILQTAGLAHTAASVSGFITGMYVVATPVLAALIFGQRVTRVVWAAVALATIGLAILSLRGFSVGYGEFITFLSALLYALHIVALSRWTSAKDAYAMATIQMIVIAAVCLIVAAPGGIVLAQTPRDWVVVVYMAVAASALAMLAQTWAQAHLSAPRTAILMTMEPVFAAFFAIAFSAEQMSGRIVIGGAFVLAAMLIAELTATQEPTPIE